MSPAAPAPFAPDSPLLELVHSLDGIVWEADPATTQMLFVSRQAEHLLGYPVSQWIAEPTFWVDHLHPEDRAWAVATCQEAVRDLRDHTFEYRMVAQDGRVVWLQDLVTVIASEGRATRLRGIMVDVSQRKEAEAQAALAQQRWRLHMDQTPLAVIEWDLDGRVTRWNPAAERIFGYLAEEALGQPIIELVVPQNARLRDQVSRLAESLTGGTAPSQVQHPNVRKDGTLITCRWFNTPLVDEANQPMGVASMALDVTDLQQASSALADSETRFRRLVELNPNAIVIQAEGQWRYANDTALRLFGAEDLATFQARPVLDWIHPNSREAARLRMVRILGGEPMPEQELSFLRNDGASFPAMVHGIEFDHQGAPAILGVIRDITPQKQAEAALERARDSYRNQMMEMPFLVWKGTPEGGCEYINQAWMDFTGLDLTQLRGNQWAARIHPEDQSALMKAYGTALATLEPMMMEFRMLTGRGDYRWVKGQGKPFYDLNGHFDGFLAACTDIHDSRTAEVALAEKELRFRTVADFTYDWEYWTNQDRDVLWMSPSCERVTGYPPDAFMAERDLLTRLIHPDDRALMAEHHRQVQSGEAAPPLDFRILHRDGRQFWVSHICTPVFDGEGRYQGRRTSNRDITDRRQAEADLVEASRQRQAMLEAASVARVVPWSMDLDQRMHWGASAGMVLGLSPEALGAHPGWPLERIHPEDRSRLQQAIQEADKGFVGSFECRMQHGSAHWIWTRWTLAREQGTFHGAIQDVTEQHAIQEQLLQSQKLESMGTLVGGIAHDFNNLLGAILGYCQLFEQDDALQARHRKGLGVIQGAAQRGRQLVNQLRGFSRKDPPNRVFSNLNAVVSEATDLVAHAMPSEVKLSLDLCPDLPSTFQDPGQVHQVVMNLVINARDAIHGPGSITLRTGHQTVSPEVAAAHNHRPGPYVFIDVADTGCGIPPDHLARIFEPFFTTKGLNGTGLGLSVAYGLVAEHGGFLECQSEVGRGTRFRVMLPVTAPPEAGA